MKGALGLVPDDQELPDELKALLETATLQVLPEPQEGAHPRGLVVCTYPQELTQAEHSAHTAAWLKHALPGFEVAVLDGGTRLDIIPAHGLVYIKAEPKLSDAAKERLLEEWERVQPGRRVAILDGGLDLQVRPVPNQLLERALALLDDDRLGAAEGMSPTLSSAWLEEVDAFTQELKAWGGGASEPELEEPTGGATPPPPEAYDDPPLPGHRES